jgi:hypothetical protein
MIKLPSRGLGIEALFDWTKEIVARVILDGRLIEDLVIDTDGASTVTVDHLIGRTVRGVIVVKSSTTASYSTTAFTSTTFTITASTGNPVVSLWVF